MRVLFTILCVLFLLSSPINSQTVDPASLTVYQTAGPITVDGLLNEVSWAIPAPYLKFRLGGTPAGYANTTTNFLVVKQPYTDTSTCNVKFLRDGTDLYISLSSDDKQVCRFDWEGDGLFMKIKDAANVDKEYKLYVGVVGGVPQFVVETNGPAATGAVVPGAGTTIYDSTNVDNGYTAELKLDLAALGFNASTPSVQVMMVIFDPDNYNLSVPPWGPNGNFAKQWWGSEWGPDMRTLNLSSTVVPVELTSFKASVIGNDAQLIWSTSTETNNQGFEIQRRINGSEFIQIGYVKGAGNSTSLRNYSYTDKNIEAGNKYTYRLKQVDMNGQYTYSAETELSVIAPAQFTLGQNYPNPFNPSTSISFSVPVKSDITLDVYNLLGQKVLTLLNDNFSAGNHNVELNASNLNSGVYIYSLTAVGENGKTFTSSKKMTLLK